MVSGTEWLSVLTLSGVNLEPGEKQIMKREYLVVVGNLGTVHSGANRADAMKTFTEYVSQSKRKQGRAANEDVTVMQDGEPIREYIASIEIAKRKTRKPALACQCSDRECPVHQGVPYCERRAAATVRRIDMEDGNTRFKMCVGCAQDCLDSGVFA
jgi:hypothetical protein